MTLENIEQLINPQLFQDQIKIEKEDGSFYEKLKMMMLIRFTEEKLAYERRTEISVGQFI